ncbi:MAG: TolC family protein, partial [Verrucomicrobiae bacterium]|nr:TolC family protein [Verrucomicrobiae bacterium]
IEGEVRDAWVAWEEGSTILDSSHKVVEQAEEALRLARASFEAGAATQLDVLQSQLELTRARLEEATALHTYHTALAGLRRAMGDIIDAKP